MWLLAGFMLFGVPCLIAFWLIGLAAKSARNDMRRAARAVADPKSDLNRPVSLGFILFSLFVLTPFFIWLFMKLGL